MTSQQPDAAELDEYVRTVAEVCKRQGIMGSNDPTRPFSLVMRELPPRRKDGKPDERFLGQRVGGVFRAEAFIDFDNHELVVSPAAVRECYGRRTTKGDVFDLYMLVKDASSFFKGFA